MYRSMTIIFVAAGLAVPLAVAAAPGQREPGLAAGTQLTSQERMKQLEIELDSLTHEKERMRSLFAVGLVPASDLRQVEARVAQVEIALAAAKRQAAVEKTNTAFERRVTINLREKPLREAVAALAEGLKGSGVTIEVDRSVGDETLVTLEAREVPVIEVLNAIASHGSLIVEPTAKGVVLTTRPLQVRVHQKREVEQLMAALTRAIDVQLRDASVRQAAQALSQASGLTVAVESTVPDATRVSVEARGVPLGAVLEAIANQTELRIARQPNGIALTTWPMLEVNGERQVFKGALAPWSDEWRALGATEFGGFPPSLTVFGPGGFGAPDTGALGPAGGPGRPGRGGGAAGGSTGEPYGPGLAGGSPFGGGGGFGAGGGFSGQGGFGAPMGGLGGFGGGGLGGGFGGQGGFGGGFIGPGGGGLGGGFGGQGGFGAPMGGLPGEGAMMGAGGRAGQSSGGLGGGMGFAAPAGAVAITSVGANSVVVAEAGFSASGSPGVWLTVYRLEGSQLRRVSSRFHAPGGARPAGPSRSEQPGMPQGLGAPAAGDGAGRGAEGAASPGAPTTGPGSPRSRLAPAAGGGLPRRR